MDKVDMSQRLIWPILAGLTFPKLHAQEVGGISASLKALLLPKAFSESKLAGHLATAVVACQWRF